MELAGRVGYKTRSQDALIMSSRPSGPGWQASDWAAVGGAVRAPVQLGAEFVDDLCIDWAIGQPSGVDVNTVVVRAIGQPN
ncbi:oxidoreductase [Streptomyces mirabilis]|uniref:oxidoreductase n=1 Tax=Streptomyces mirabilis TaxID=68239 RepID=UPI003F4B5A04